MLRWALVLETPACAVREDGMSALFVDLTPARAQRRAKGLSAQARLALCVLAASALPFAEFYVFKDPLALPYCLVQELETSGSCWPGKTVCDPWISVLCGEKVTPAGSSHSECQC